MSEQPARYATSRAVRSEWTHDDQLALGYLQGAVWHAVDRMNVRTLAEWITEETLWQIRGMLLYGGSVRLPQIGEIRLEGPGGLPPEARFEADRALIAEWIDRHSAETESPR